MKQSIEKKERVKGYLDLLCRAVQTGWMTWSVFEGRGDAQFDDRIGGFPHLFRIVSNACTEYIFLTLAKIIDDRDGGNSLTIHSLLNYIEQNADAFPEDQRASVKNQVAEHRNKLAECAFANTRKIVLRERDRVIAHFDKMLVTKPKTALLANPEKDPDASILECREIGRALRVSLDVLNFYQGCLGFDAFTLDPYEPHLGEELNCLISKLRA